MTKATDPIKKANVKITVENPPPSDKFVCRFDIGSGIFFEYGALAQSQSKFEYHPRLNNPDLLLRGRLNKKPEMLCFSYNVANFP